MAFEINDAMVERAMEILNGDRHWKARAAYEKADRDRKSLFARLQREDNEGKTVSARESFALLHPHYVAHMGALEEIEAEYYAAKDERDSADAVLRAWQTMSANQRGAERVR